MNGHGDVVGLSNNTGKQLNSYTYDIWGGPETVKETVPNVLRYAGEYWDDTTGLQYLRARWYDPGTARFMGEDTYQGQISDPQSLNWYAYVANNPLGYVDPSGHEFMPTTKGGIFYTNQKTIIHCQRVGMGTCWNEFKAGTMQASMAVANFLIVDDINTILDPKSSTYDKTLALAGFIPVGKFVKGGKLIIQLTSKEGRYVERSVKLTEKNLKLAKALPCNCFTAGTKVQTDEGEKNIEDIKVGDRVLSKDEATGEVAYKEVTATFNHQTDEIYNIHVGGQEIESTFNHPFYVKDKGWTFVKDLKVGDLLVQSDGNTLKVDSIELEHKHVTVYNMTVDEFHTYFVSDLGIWVHNTNCNFSVWNKGSFDAIEGSAEYHFKRHGKEVGAEDLAQYLRKAEEFAKTAKKGSTKSYVNEAVEGTIRYKKNGKYIDIAPDGTIVSFGKQ
uniref:polymorphic toxin-type HINT domain-containing protein n=1 Tax=Paenibacillus farraposensis TaxID=2807095 RepID=UPI0036700CCA